MKIPKFIEDGMVPEPVRQHLLRDVGPKAAEDGGELLLSAAMTPSLLRLIAHLGSGDTGL